MSELTTTRANPMVDPALSVWGWEIPVYLFLGGLVAGMMIISGYLLFSGRHRDARCSCFLLPGLGLALLSSGMLALFLDLEHKPHFWRLYATFEPTSPMSWGSWILLAVYPALLANFLLRLPEPLAARFPRLEAGAARLRDGLSPRAVGGANLLLGALLGIYTGVLLSALGAARPLWNSPLLGPLFLVSGLSSAAAFVHLVARNAEERVLLARADNGFLAAELLLVALLLVGLASGASGHIEAASLLLTGPFAAAFWVLFVAGGILLPLAVQSLAVAHRIRHTPVAPILVVAGALVFRFLIVAAGQHGAWSPQ